MPSEGFKIWRNPGRDTESPLYMGEFYPPSGQVFFYMADLKALAFPSGEYTVRAPESIRKVYVLPEWQGVTVLQ